MNYSDIRGKAVFLYLDGCISGRGPSDSGLYSLKLLVLHNDRSPTKRESSGLFTNV